MAGANVTVSHVQPNAYCSIAGELNRETIRIRKFADPLRVPGYKEESSQLTVRGRAPMSAFYLNGYGMYANGEQLLEPV